MIFVALYVLIGIGLAYERLHDIAAEARPDDIASVAIVAARWVATWPWWWRR